MTALAEIQPRTSCSQPGCDRPIHCSGFCTMHYNRRAKGLDMAAPPYGYTPWGQLIDRAMALADAQGTEDWGKELALFRQATERIVACGFETIKIGWKKKRVVLRMVRTRRRCSVEGCSRIHRAKGLCDKHYLQHRRDQAAMAVAP